MYNMKKESKMKKLIAIFVVLLLLIVGGAYWLIFTASGNDTLKPLIEANLNKKLPVRAELATFRIFPLDIELLIGKDTRIEAKGALDIFAQHLDISYGIHIAKLQELEPLIGQKLRGSLFTKGTIEGDRERIDIIGDAQVVGSNTTYHMILDEFEPKSLDAKISHADLAKILYMLSLPHFADALIDSTIHLINLEPKELAGSIISHVYNGKTDASVLQKEFNFTNAYITFRADQTTNIKKGIVLSDVKVVSSLATLTTKGAKYDINKGIFNANYSLHLPDLGKLYFATKQKMRGSMDIQGIVRKDSNLLVTAKTKTLGGAIAAKLVDKKLDAKLKKIQVVKLTHMLYYPKIFDSSMDADLVYNLATKKGELHAQAFNGRILPNKMSFLLNQLAHFDITKEIYKVTKLDSTIDDKEILSNLDMQSRLTHISTHNAKIDLARQQIDAKLRIEIQKRPVYVKLSGSLTSPNVKVDAKELIKSRAKKEIQKRLKGKLPSAAKEILNLF